MEFVNYLLISVQIVFGYNLIAPAIFYLIYLSRTNKILEIREDNFDIDYAIVVTAYEQTHTIPFVIKSILKLNYAKYLVYVVADKCDTTNLIFEDPRILILKPPITLGSNTKSHQYAIDNFIREHDMITIIDSDNLLDANYLIEINKFVDAGSFAVQGVRMAKNLNTNIARLDAARDIFYHFYDGKVLYQAGSSATLSGSGMAFKLPFYKAFLEENQIAGAGFDKVLQAWIVKSNHRIAFAERALVYDEKTSKSDQLVKQRSRWINTWFKYFTFGFELIYLGVRNFSRNQFLFGLVLLRPPLFIFLIVSFFALIFNLLIGKLIFMFVWMLGFLVFGLSFFISLIVSNADKAIYTSLIGIPRFIFFQLLSLLNSRNANSISVATKHDAFPDDKVYTK